MALIKEPDYKPGSRAQREGEHTLEISQTESGARYRFTLKRKHIEVEMLEPMHHTKRQKTLDGSSPARKVAGKKTAPVDDWNTALSDAEKVQVFSIILDSYRERSLGDNGFKGAAIGVVAANGGDAKGDPFSSTKINGQSRLFIGTNTQRWASPYFKDCAEQNMVNAATDTLMYERSRKPVSKQKKPVPPQFQAIYVLQATGADKPISCPCGKCTDMLSNVMVKDGSSKVVTLPLLSDAMRAQIKGDTKVVNVNSAATSLAQIKLPGESDHYEVWQTPIETLNRNRMLALDTKTANLQRNALKDLSVVAAGMRGLPEDRADSDLDMVVKAMNRINRDDSPIPIEVTHFVDAFLSTVKKSVKLVDQRIQRIKDSMGQPAERAAENTLLQRKSFAGLDCAVRGNDFDMALINRFMVHKITDTIADRMRSTRGDVTGERPDKLRAWVKKNIHSIRCVAIQMDDGTFRFAVQADSTLDNAMPNAEVVALEQASETLGRYGVRHVWAMEMNPKDIEQGVLRTSPKEGIERLMKRASPHGVDFHFIPFNAGDLTNTAVKSLTRDFKAKDIYPSEFKGANAGNKDAATAPVPPKPRNWATLVRQLQASADTHSMAKS